MKKRVWIGAGLIVLGMILILLPIHITMTGLTFAGYGVLCLADRFAEQRGWGRGWHAAIISVGCVVAAALLIGISLVLLKGGSQWDEARKVDCVVVLGAQVHGDQPSRTLRKRLDTALALMEENHDAAFIVTGGKGSDEQAPEAEVMYEYMVRNGADVSRLYRETEAHNTLENLKFSAKIARDLGVDGTHPAIVTSEFHLCRARYIAKRLGMEPVGVASETTPWILMINYALREVYAFVKVFLTAQ